MIEYAIYISSSYYLYKKEVMYAFHKCSLKRQKYRKKQSLSIEI